MYDLSAFCAQKGETANDESAKDSVDSEELKNGPSSCRVLESNLGTLDLQSWAYMPSLFKSCGLWTL